MAAIHEEHGSGAHRVREEPFPGWIPDDERRQAERLSVEAAFGELPAFLRPDDGGNRVVKG